MARWPSMAQYFLWPQEGDSIKENRTVGRSPTSAPSHMHLHTPAHTHTHTCTHVHTGTHGRVNRSSLTFNNVENNQG